MKAGAGLLAALALLLAVGAQARVQWSVKGDYVNFPFGSDSPPLVLRTMEGDAPDRIVMVSNSTAEGWELAAFEADTGAVAWRSVIAPPDAQNAQLTGLTTGQPPSQQGSSSLNMLFIQMGRYVVAVDGASGRKLWQHATYNASTPKITGYAGPGGPPRVYLTATFMDSTRAVPVPINRIEALDPATGTVVWANFTAPAPPSGLPSADTAALHGVTPAPGLAVFAQGARMYGLSAEDGRQLWGVLVTAGTGAGLNPNISSVTLVEAAPDLPNGRRFPLLLLQSSTWDQTRFLGWVLNGTNATAPPTEAWKMQGNNNFEGSLNDGLSRLGLAVPAASPTDGAFLFWSNRTSYDINNGGRPLYTTHLVGRSLKDGSPVWASSMPALGFSQLPVSPPVAHVGVAAAVTGSGMLVLDAGSGRVRYGVSEAPAKPEAAGGPYTYMPLTTFVNNQGHLAAVRCLGGQAQPGSLCMYNGFIRAADPENAAPPRRRFAAAAAAAAGALALVIAL